jgi:hypothetical protein
LEKRAPPVLRSHRRQTARNEIDSPVDCENVFNETVNVLSTCGFQRTRLASNALLSLRVVSRKRTARSTTVFKRCTSASGTMREHQFRVAQNPGERIIDLMPKYFRRLLRKTCPGGAQRCFRPFCPPQPPLHEASRDSGEVTCAGDEIQISFRHQSCDLRLPGRTSHQNQGRCFAQLAKRFDEWRAH